MSNEILGNMLQQIEDFGCHCDPLHNPYECGIHILISEFRLKLREEELKGKRRKEDDKSSNW